MLNSNVYTNVYYLMGVYTRPAKYKASPFSNVTSFSKVVKAFMWYFDSPDR